MARSRSLAGDVNLLLVSLELKLMDSLDCALKEGCRTLSKMHPKKAYNDLMSSLQ
jgi:hypothetical protein